MNPTQSRHTAEKKTSRRRVSVTADPAWLAADICRRVRATESSDEYASWVKILTDYMTRLAVAESALAGIPDPAAFVKSVREAVAHHEEQTRVWGGEEGDENQVKYHTERASKLREHLGESNAA